MSSVASSSSGTCARPVVMRPTMPEPSALERLNHQRLAVVEVEGAPVFVPIKG
ncbi:hypothetical protein [Vreelandella alkaliphila]|nr:hypothetical protein [Halomonas sp. 3A7M]